MLNKLKKITIKALAEEQRLLKSKRKGNTEIPNLNSKISKNKALIRSLEGITGKKHNRNINPYYPINVKNTVLKDDASDYVLKKNKIMDTYHAQIY